MRRKLEKKCMGIEKKQKTKVSDAGHVETKH